MRAVGVTMPRLLVSVRDAAEARAAIDGGADVIDVKEPSAGPLGAAGIDATVAVAAAVATVPGLNWTAACGELADAGVDGVASHVAAILSGLDSAPGGRLARPWLVKVGLSRMAGRDWAGELDRLGSLLPEGVVQAAVAYADWRDCGGPDPDAVCRRAKRLGGVLLLDTFDKAAGNVFAIAGEDAVVRLSRTAQAEGVSLALAGRLGPEDAERVARVRPDIVAVRSAACGHGRLGRVGASRTGRVRRALCGG